MSFSIDKQTQEELNLLGKFRQDSVYHLFNKVRTRGGEVLLDTMFRHPLTAMEDINERAGVFLFFQQQGLRFPFDVQQVNLMREYLDTGSSKNPLQVLASTLIKKGLASLTRDERYKKMVQGLQATIVTLNECHAFINTLPDTGIGPYAVRIQAVRDIFTNKQIERLRSIDIYQSLSVKTTAFYNHLLKGQLLIQMESILSFIYEVDVNIAVSDVARARGFHYATALPREANIFSVRGLCHPCIDNAIGNDLLLDESGNVLFLTGANMAGKSTLMKSIGISLYLAHIGFPVAAVKMNFSVKDGLYSSINVADNIGMGYSHFYAEVIRVKLAAQAAASGKRLLLMFDELFKGTNVKDAYEGTLAVTEAFAEYRKCLFIISTHIIEVGEALSEEMNIRFAYMPTVMEGANPRYTYTLEKGVTEDRQGMMIIRNEGVLSLLGKE